MSDEAKKAILARRARFVAAALAGLAVEGCGKSTVPVDATDGGPAIENTTPQPCLSIAYPRPEAPDAAPPRPCLKAVAPPQPDGGKVNCSPPYTVDSQGIKHYKIECL